MFFKNHKSSKDISPAKTQKIEPPSPQPPPRRIVKDGGTRICHCEPQKSKPNPPHRQYGSNFIPAANTPPPYAPPNQYGSIGSIDNSELDILIKNKEIFKSKDNVPKWVDVLTTGNVSEMRNIKGADKMEEHCNGTKCEYKEAKYQYNFKYTLKNGKDFNKTFTVDRKIEKETFDEIMKGQGDKLVFMLDNAVLIMDKESIETLLIKQVEEN